MNRATTTARDSHGRPHLWTAAVMLAAAPFVVSLSATLWHTPFPITEAVALFEDVVARPPERFFSPDTSYYRPLYYLTLYASWRHGGTLDGTLASIKLLTIVPVVLMVAVLIWHLRPRTALDAAAAGLAVAVLIGSSGFRDNLEIGLSYTIVGMPIALIVWVLLNREHRVWHTPLIIALTLVAIGFKEQGLVLVPLVLAAWWTRAPGASRGLAAAIGVIGVAYVTLRLTASGTWEVFEQDLGLGFNELDRHDAAARFGAFPYWMYAYNSASTVAHLLFAEPTRGVFRMIHAAVENRLEPWQVAHVGSSAALTAIIAWWGMRAVRVATQSRWTLESRLWVATVVVVLTCGLLSFNYPRERLGGMAVAFYAMAAFFSVRAAAARVVSASPPRLIAAGLILTFVVAAWQTRAIATLEYARTHSWGNQEEWFVRLPARRTEFAHRRVYLRILESMVPQGTDPAAPRPTRFPDWVYLVLSRP